LVREGRAIMNAPVTFVLCVAFLATIIGWAIYRWEDNRYRDQLANKDGQIALLTTKFQSTSETLEAAKQGLATNQPAALQTRLILEFVSGDGVPTQLAADNLYSWYILNNELISVKLNNESKVVERSTVRIVNLTWIFDAPSTYKQIKVLFRGGTLPRYEIKDNSARHAIIAFSGVIPVGVLELYLIQ